MKPTAEPDFYVGYSTDTPLGLRRFLRGVVVALFIGGLTLAVSFALLQSPFDESLFEFGQPRSLTGVLHLSPQPHIVLSEALARPEALGAGPPYRSALLVGLGKHGASETSAGDSLQRLDGRAIRAQGTLIARGSVAMLELSAPAAAAEPTAPSVLPRENLNPPTTQRTVSLIGEIVDSKCFLGVMNPGRGKSHRACASLCLDGGVPPAFLVRANAIAARSGPDAADQPQEWVALLLGPNGKPITENLASWVGTPVRLEGLLVERDGRTPELHANPADLRRVR